MMTDHFEEEDEGVQEALAMTKTQWRLTLVWLIPVTLVLGVCAAGHAAYEKIVGTH